MHAKYCLGCRGSVCVCGIYNSKPFLFFIVCYCIVIEARLVEAAES